MLQTAFIILVSVVVIGGIGAGIGVGVKKKLQGNQTSKKSEKEKDNDGRIKNPMFIPLKKKGQPIRKKDFYTGVYYPVDEDKKEKKPDKKIKKTPVKFISSKKV